MFDYGATGNQVSLGSTASDAAGVEDLSVPQAEILAQLLEFGSKVIVPKSRFGQNDLAALSAATGTEFAMFTLRVCRMIVRGDRPLFQSV